MRLGLVPPPGGMYEVVLADDGTNLDSVAGLVDLPSPQRAMSAPLPPVPDWLVEWVHQARSARQEGSQPVRTVQEEYDRLHRGIRRRKRSDGRTAYEVRYQGRYLGTTYDIEEAIQWREEATCKSETQSTE